VTAEPWDDAAHAVPAFSRAALQELMWEHAGLVRDEGGLGHAASVIAGWRAQSRAVRSERDFEDENLLLVAEHLVAAALARRESVGAHFRSDAGQAEPAAARQEALAC
jgi:L-aspartate oxidase